MKKIDIVTIKRNIYKIWNHPGFRKYLANTSWLFMGRVFRMVLGFFVGVWVARYLGPDRYGLLSYAQAFVGLFGAIATLGLDGILVREIVKFPEKEGELIGTSFVLKLIGAFFTLLILAIAINFTSSDQITKILIFIIASSTIFQSFNIIDIYFQAKVKSKYAVLANIFAFLLGSTFKIYLILTEAPLIMFGIAILLDSIFLASWYVFWFFRFIKGKAKSFFRSLSFKADVAFSLLKDSWPLILSSMAIMVYMKTDQVMIKEMLGTRELGYYSIVVKLTEIWYFIPIIISSSLFPSIINAKKINKRLYYIRLQKLYTFLFWLALSIALFLTLFGDWLISYIYGCAYTKASPVLKIYAWVLIFVFFGVASSKWLLNENLQKFSFLRTLYGACINIFLNLILINKYGIVGAAIATFISQSISGFWFDLFFKKTRISFFLKLKSILLWRIYDKEENL